MTKTILVLSILLIITGGAFSQSLEDINTMMDKNKYNDARTAIDKYISNPKNAESAEGWYYKGRIYNSLSRDAATTKSDAYTLKLASYEAFKKHQQLDKLDIRMKSEEYRSYLELYSGFYDLGAYQYNNSDFKGAYNAFTKAQEVENFILSKNYKYEDFKLNKLDTMLLANIALAAINIQDTANAVMNYRKIIDAGVAGKEYEQVYAFLIGYYNERGDNANMQALLTKAKAAYPENNMWNELEMDKLTKSGDKSAMFAKYDELYVKNPNNFGNTYNYAIEMYNNIYKDAKDTTTASKNKLTAILKSAISADTTIDAGSLMANHLFNAAAEYSTAAALIKSTKPEDIKKKKDLNLLSNAKMDETIPYAETVVKYYRGMPKLSTRHKANYLVVVGFLTDIYTVKGNKAKIAEYDKLRDSIKF